MSALVLVLVVALAAAGPPGSGGVQLKDPLAPASRPAPAPASMPASRPALRIVDTPIVWDAERERLTREYRAQRYGQVGVTSRIAPVGVVLHLTGEPTFARSFALYERSRIDAQRLPHDAERSPLGPSVHFLIDTDGTVHRLLNEGILARHAGPLNATTTGVALVGARQAAIPSAQREATRALVRRLDHRGRAVDFVVGHHELEELRDSPVWLDVEPTPPVTAPDPGPALVDDVRDGRRPRRLTDPGSTFLYDRAWLEQRSLQELILLRNRVYARYGRSFPTRPWVQEHFDAEPGYRRNPDFEEADLTPLDRDNVRLIARVERSFSPAELRARKRAAKTALDRRLADEALKRATRLAPLVGWRPGRAIPRRAVTAADRLELLAAYVRMTVRLRLGGMSAGDCVFAEEATGVDGVCEAWESGAEGRDRKTLPAVDRRSLARVERGLARLVVERRYEREDPLPGCREDCRRSWTEPGADGVEVERAPTPKELKACLAECERDLRSVSRVVRQDKNQALREVDRGIHAIHGALVNEVLYGDMTGFG